MARLAVLCLLLWPCLAFGASIQLPSVSLPASEPAAPTLLLQPADLPALQARRSDPAYSGYYTQLKGFVDGRLSGLQSNPTGIDDDTLSRIARAAGLLQQLGETPPSQFATYRDVGVTALRSIRTRVAGSILGGPNDINVLQDSPRLQSMAEGYDLLRGTGVAPADESTIRGIIRGWAEAMRNDYNLAGALGVPGHRDNWAIKGGASLITVALALPGDSRAPTWLSTGLAWVNESLDATASSTGWYRESPHYLNYSLNNLVMTAWNVRSATGEDWFPALRPFVTTALAMRQPDGTSMPFEEGVVATFPYDVFADRYPDLTGPLQWAWNHSPKDASAFENQAIQAVTRFVLDSSAAEAAPAAPSTRFIGPDAHVQVLRSDWSASAVQATMITAKDHSSSTLVASRHNMQNPLDLTVYGAGQLLLPTSSGGPTVTTSSNRSYYLLASSKNVPLVSGSAPFLTEEARISSDLRLDGTLLDTARTTVEGYPNQARVSRLVTLLDDRAVVLVDEAAGSNLDFALPFHGRGTYTNAGSNPTRLRWDFTGASLDLWAVATGSLQVATNAGYYAPAWGQEESLTAAQLRSSGASPRILTLLSPRASSTEAFSVTSLPNSGLVASDGGKTYVLTTGTTALLGVTRTQDGALTGFALVHGTELKWQGQTIVSATFPATLEAVIEGDTVRLHMPLDVPEPFTLQNLSGIDAAQVQYVAVVNGAIDPGALTQSSGKLSLSAVPAGSEVVLRPGQPPTVDPVEDRTTAEGQLFQLQLQGSDPEGRPLRWSMEVMPPAPGASLGPMSGRLLWTPGYDLATRETPGVFSFTFTATDGFYSTSRTMTLTVTNTNRPPTWGAVDVQLVVQGATLQVPTTPADPDGDPLTLSVDLSPAQVTAPTIDANGLVTWATTAEVPYGTYRLDVHASDGLATTDQRIDVAVVSALPSDAGPPMSDAGPPELDGGPQDAGTPDAGPALAEDAGSSEDAGTGPEKVPTGCGCQSSPGGVVAVALLTLAARRRRPALRSSGCS